MSTIKVCNGCDRRLEPGDLEVVRVRVPKFSEVRKDPRTGAPVLRSVDLGDQLFHGSLVVSAEPARPLGAEGPGHPLAQVWVGVDPNVDLCPHCLTGAVRTWLVSRVLTDPAVAASRAEPEVAVPQPEEAG